MGGKNACLVRSCCCSSHVTVHFPICSPPTAAARQLAARMGLRQLAVTRTPPTQLAALPPAQAPLLSPRPSWQASPSQRWSSLPCSSRPSSCCAAAAVPRSPATLASPPQCSPLPRTSRSVCLSWPSRPKAWVLGRRHLREDDVVTFTNVNIFPALRIVLYVNRQYYMYGAGGRVLMLVLLREGADFGFASPSSSNAT